MIRMKRLTHFLLTFGLLATFAVGLTACELKITGEKETLTFQAAECGGLFPVCTLEKTIAVGGSVTVKLDGRLDLEDITLISEDSELFAVKTHPGGVNGQFIITATAAGSTHLQAIDGNGLLVDEVVIRGVVVEHLEMTPLSAMEEMMNEATPDLRTFQVEAGKEAVFLVGPDFGEAGEGMGNFDYTVATDSEALNESLAAASPEVLGGMERGLFQIVMPTEAGTHLVVISAVEGVLELAIEFDVVE